MKWSLLLSWMLCLSLLMGCDGAYQYTKDSKGRDARLNKWTGKLETLQSDGSWATKRQEEAIAEKEAAILHAEIEKRRQVLPLQQSAKITGTGHYYSDYFKVTISNSSDWAVTEVDIEVSIIDSSSKKKLDKMTRTIVFGFMGPYNGSYDPVRPHQVQHESIKLDRMLEAGQGYEWTISELRGYAP